MLRNLVVILISETKLIWRKPQSWLYPFCFFMIAITLFPLAFSADPVLLHKLAPGCIWLSALFASLLCMENLFLADLEDGALEQMLLAQIPLSLILFIKIFIYWAAIIFPLIILVLLSGWLFSLAASTLPLLVVTLLLGTAIVAWIAALGVSLTIGLRYQGSMLGLLVLPLATPILIFGVTIIMQAEAGLGVSGPLAFIAGISLFATILMPSVLSAVLRLSLDE